MTFIKKFTLWLIASIALLGGTTTVWTAASNPELASINLFGFRLFSANLNATTAHNAAEQTQKTIEQLRVEAGKLSSTITERLQVTMGCIINQKLTEKKQQLMALCTQAAALNKQITALYEQTLTNHSDELDDINDIYDRNCLNANEQKELENWYEEEKKKAYDAQIKNNAERTKLEGQYNDLCAQIQTLYLEIEKETARGEGTDLRSQIGRLQDVSREAVTNTKEAARTVVKESKQSIRDLMYQFFIGGTGAVTMGLGIYTLHSYATALVGAEWNQAVAGAAFTLAGAAILWASNRMETSDSPESVTEKPSNSC